MSCIGDFVLQGTNEDLVNNLVSIAQRLKNAGSSLYNRDDIGDGCRVYPAISNSTAEQLLLLSRNISESIEVSAGVCRAIFEMNITIRYCMVSDENLMSYAERSATDEISLYKRIIEYAKPDADAALVDELRKRITEIKDLLNSHGRKSKHEALSFSKMANEVGVGDEYSSMYEIYSKYIHAGAWIVLRDRGHTDFPEMRSILQIKAQQYAADTLYRVSSMA